MHVRTCLLTLILYPALFISDVTGAKCWNRMRMHMWTCLLISFVYQALFMSLERGDVTGLECMPEHVFLHYSFIRPCLFQMSLERNDETMHARTCLFTLFISDVSGTKWWNWTWMHARTCLFTLILCPALFISDVSGTKWWNWAWISLHLNDKKQWN